MGTEIQTIRKDFRKNILTEKDCHPDPFQQFQGWLQAAMENDAFFANAFTLSTVDAEGMPDARTILLRNVSHGGMTFFTNYKSSKGFQIQQNNKACILFFWKELERQIKIQGHLVQLPAAESDDYFQSRPFESQVGAWASQQSQTIESREKLDARFETELLKFKDQKVPRPEHWGGYVLIPDKFEFWQGRSGRLHDRIRYKKVEDAWGMERLMP